IQGVLRGPDLIAQHPGVIGRINSHLEAQHPAVTPARRADHPLDRRAHLALRPGPDGQLHDQLDLRGSWFRHRVPLARLASPITNYISIGYRNIMDDQRTRAGRPRNPALDRAILSAAARQLGELGYARMSLESVAAAAVIGSLRVEEPPAGAPSPRAFALAILENFHRNLRATPALAILGSLLAEEERHPELLHRFKTHIVEPRRALLRRALAAGALPPPADLDALTSMLIGSFYGRYVTIAGLPDDWPDRVLSAVWPL